MRIYAFTQRSEKNGARFDKFALKVLYHLGWGDANFENHYTSSWNN